MKIGFVINSRVPSLEGFREGMSPAAFFRGWDDIDSPMSFMRFHWLADEINKVAPPTYELYRPGRRYAAVVFVKSMGSHCLRLAQKLRGEGTKVIFDANVDYYTRGPAAIGAVPVSDRQRSDAIEMTKEVDTVMASSRHLAEICSQFSRRPAHWIPDNVNFRYVPVPHPRPALRPLTLWWSGMPGKLGDFLSIENVLRRFANFIRLAFVTHGRPRLKDPALQLRLERLLQDVPHKFYPFQSIQKLQALYAQSGLIVSPRFLDTPYNLGHSEWKITLGMACGLPALCSPVPSYRDVAKEATEGAIRIAETPEQWAEALDAALSRKWNISQCAEWARAVVVDHYSTPVIAARHRELVLDTCQTG